MASSEVAAHTFELSHYSVRPQAHQNPANIGREKTIDFNIKATRARRSNTKALSGKMATPNSNANIPTWSFTPATTSAQPATSTPQYPPTSTPLPSSPQTPAQEQDTTFRPPPNYPAAFTPRPRGQRSRSGTSTHSTFHHYQPRSQPAANTTTSSHPITAPFQLPRMPAWPSLEFVMGQQSSGRARGYQYQPQPENIPIDPRLLGEHDASRQGSNSSQNERGQGGWSGGSSGA